MAYRVVLIGAGLISKHHLNAITELDELIAAAVADIDENKGREVAAEYGISYYSDYQEMILDEKPDIVIIALPHYLHEECAVWCAGQGCHLLLEKPMALNLKQCDAILHAADSAGIKLMIGHTQHYLPANLQAKQLIESGDLGKLIAIHDTRHRYYYSKDRPAWFLEKAKAGGGIMMNLGAHSVDKVQWLTGSRIERVKASLTYEGERGDVEGSGVVYLTTSEGLSAVVIQSGYAGVDKDETELIFTGGMAKLISAKGLWISNNGSYVRYEDKPATTFPEDPFVLQFKDLLASISNDTESSSSGRYGRSVISVLEAIYRSNQTGVEEDVE